MRLADCVRRSRGCFAGIWRPGVLGKTRAHLPGDFAGGAFLPAEPRRRVLSIPLVWAPEALIGRVLQWVPKRICGQRKIPM
jgi:hypothetical protein